MGDTPGGTKYGCRGLVRFTRRLHATLGSFESHQSYKNWNLTQFLSGKLLHPAKFCRFINHSKYSELCGSMRFRYLWYFISPLFKEILLARRHVMCDGRNRLAFNSLAFDSVKWKPLSRRKGWRSNRHRSKIPIGHFTFYQLQVNNSRSVWVDHQRNITFILQTVSVIKHTVINTSSFFDI